MSHLIVELGLGSYLLLQSLLFQFLYGAIKTRLSQSLLSRGLYFNSSTVRLKPLSIPSVMPYIHDFNSSTVRLKPEMGERRFTLFNNFNSSTVRLKHLKLC